MTVVLHPDQRLLSLTAVWCVGLALSGAHPYDQTTWWMEVAPALVVLPLLWTTRHRMPLTTLALTLISLHGIVLMVGGAYTYARVPLGYDVQIWLHLDRNPYDRFGHLMQGFVPAVVIRELLVRAGRLTKGALLTTLTLACCLAVSAAYELVEFGAAMALGQGADEFLGTQGDQWDTQWDMLFCLIGAAAALAVTSRMHDRMLARIAAIGQDADHGDARRRP